MLGVGQFWKILGDGRIAQGDSQPVLQETKLGWILAGSMPKYSINSEQSRKVYANVSINQLNINIERFWKLEDVSQNEIYTRKYVKDMFRTQYLRTKMEDSLSVYHSKYSLLT